jgi:hypothetical protein
MEAKQACECGCKGRGGRETQVIGFAVHQWRMGALCTHSACFRAISITVIFVLLRVHVLLIAGKVM